jgi:hypothetical protein
MINLRQDEEHVIAAIAKRGIAHELGFEPFRPYQVRQRRTNLWIIRDDKDRRWGEL